MLCQNCDTVGIDAKCFVCDGHDELIKCKERKCNKSYHKACLKHWPHTLLAKLQCPQHLCQTCEWKSTEPCGAYVDTESQLVKCLRCPASYHRHIACVPAGSILLSDTFMICPRHRKPEKPVNVSFCFGCDDVGTLYTCDECPAAYHAGCLELDPSTDEKFVCPPCARGRLPLYGDVVWAKLSTCKWWPAVIVPPW